MSAPYIRGDQPWLLMLAAALFSPVALAGFVLALPLYFIWVACGAILSVITRRNCCLIMGELPRFRPEDSP